MQTGIVLQTQGPLTTVTLCNPDKLNAMSRAMWRALRQAFVSIQTDPDVRCVLVRGAGSNFCAGGDIAEYPGFRFDEAQLRHFHEDEVWAALAAMLACDVPLIAQIQGVCMGAGVEIASTCDLRLAAVDASFGAPIARLGFPMAPREAALVGHAVGEMTARAMLLAAEVFPASHMAQQGFLTHVLPVESLGEACQTLAARVAALAPQAARLNKQTLRALRAGQELQNPYAYAASAEHQEGIGAFLAKRKPQFQSDL
jgi:enoyl-CoA hydratase/carnithine racemase